MVCNTSPFAMQLRCNGFRDMLRVPLFSLIAARSLSAGHLSTGSFCSKYSSCHLALHPSKFSQRAQIPLFKFCSRSLSGILNIQRKLNNCTVCEIVVTMRSQDKVSPAGYYIFSVGQRMNKQRNTQEKIL